MFTNLTEALDHNRKTQSPYLDLGRLGLQGNEPELEQLKDFTWLEAITFSNKWYEFDEQINEVVWNISQNNGNFNKLIYLPPHPHHIKQLILAGEKDNEFEISNISQIKKLKNLIYLDIDYNQIIDITPLNDLKDLSYLSMNHNQIIDITPIKEIKTLCYLSLSHNKIDSTIALKLLKNITFLDVSFNNISDIKHLKWLDNLAVLDISFNQVSDIAYLKELGYLNKLYLNHNPFWNKLPIEIKAKNGLEVLQYWHDTYNKKNLPKPIRETKIVFVGEGGSGKTSLMHTLLYDKQVQTKRTEKIEIHTNDTLFTYGKKKEKLKLRFWDFGGQDIMHATHKFFMSNRTLYVLVVNGRKEETDALQNWVEMLKSSIGDSPVLLVVNHLDEHNNAHRLGDLGLKVHFPNLILPVIETSWKTNRGLDTLREAIQSTLQKMPHFQEDFSAIYQNIKEHLESIDKPYINYKEYENICEQVTKMENEVFTRDSQILLADILNDLGVMLSFRKKNDKLEDLLIFKPEWIVEGVYQIVNAHETVQKKGKIKEITAQMLLKDINYNEKDERLFILEMMEYFKLAYAQYIPNPNKQILNKEKYYFIPSLFDKNPPDIFSAWQVGAPLRVRFQYEIWRNDYISYFLEDQYQHIKEGTHWVNGAILQYGEQQVKIEAVRYQKYIDIQIAGKQDKRYALWRIREALAKVHAMFDETKLGFSMWVVHKEAGKEDKFEYNYLKIALENGVKEHFSAVFLKKLSIPALLEGVSLNQTETKETLQKALAYLENASFSGYFAEMDKVEKDFQQNITYSQLKNDFVNGEKSSYFAERLRTFARLFV